MSELTFKGNTVSKFGTYLPAPYIDRVDLLDDRVTTYISLFFVSSGDDTVDDEIITHLNSDINVYCMHAWSTSAMSTSLSTSATFGYSESDWQSVVNGEVNIFKALHEARQDTDIAAYDLVQQKSIPTDMNMNDESSTYWTKAEDIYSEEGQRIIRFQTSVDYLFNTSAWTPLAFGTPLELWFDDNPQFWYTFAYTSTYTYSEDTIETALENTRSLTNKTSDISYEKVFSEGKIRRLYTQYFDAEDVIYDDIPLESLGGFYYTTSGIAQDQIKTYFEDLVTEFRTRAETMEDSDELSDLENMLDNISSVLSGYGDTATLLVQLNYLRDLFTSKSNGDVVGKLYLRFRKRIYSTNEAIEGGTLLQNRVTRNPKIVDSKKSEATEGYATTSYNENWPENHPNYLYDNAYYSLVTYLDDDYENFYYNKGFFFFDYEKAYRETSELSQYINVNKLYQLWGLEPVYSKFRVHHAKLTRTTSDEYSTTLSTTLYPGLSYPRSQYYSGEATAPSTTADASSYGGNFENSYVVLRNFLPVEESPWAFGSDEIDNYHLMCFEFKDEFGSLSPKAYDEYEIQVAIEDNSVEVLEELAAQYNEVITELEGYVNSSKEDCSHDQETGDFKPFFIDAMDNLYGANLETSPWYRAAVMYNLHRDLLLNTFDGDMEALLENVEEIVDTIGPYTGNRFVLETFQINFETLYDSLYVNSIPGFTATDRDGFAIGPVIEFDAATDRDGFAIGPVIEFDAATDQPTFSSATSLYEESTFSSTTSLYEEDATSTDIFAGTKSTFSSAELLDLPATGESEMLIFTNNYTIPTTSEAASAPPPGDLAYEMSYRSSWATGESSGFVTVDWSEWVDQVEEYQDMITAGTGIGTTAKAMLYAWMSGVMELALENENGWAYIVSQYESVFNPDGSTEWLEGTVQAELLGQINSNSLTEFGSRDYLYDKISDSSTNAWKGLTGWLRYMWGAIKNDGVLEPSDVSNGYSTE